MSKGRQDKIGGANCTGHDVLGQVDGNRLTCVSKCEIVECEHGAFNLQ